MSNPYHLANGSPTFPEEEKRGFVPFHLRVVVSANPVGPQKAKCENGDLSSPWNANASACEASWTAKWKKHQLYMQALEQLERAQAKELSKWNGKRAYDMYEPEWVCESEMRVGPEEVNVGDGPKFVCGVETLREEQDCLVYSIGSGFRFQFEEGVRKHAPNCVFHVFDGTMDLNQRALPSGLEAKRIHFHNWNLQAQSGRDAKGYPSRSLEDVLRELDHVGKTIHIFKIDCEGCEYTVLPRLARMVQDGAVTVGQIQVEVHGTDARKIQALFQSLRGAGFMIFHKERNHWGCQGYRCVEYALVSLAAAKKDCPSYLCTTATSLFAKTDSEALAHQGLNKDKQSTAAGASIKSNNTAWILNLLRKPCRKLGYSQGNQDCILDTIFAHIGVRNKFFVEYGFNTNKQCSGSGPNTCKLWRDGWHGLLLDGTHENLSINLHAHFLYQNNIVSILEKYSVPEEFDFLSSDMDSHDFFVLLSVLRKYKPRVVSTEYNSNWPLKWAVAQLDPTLVEDLWNSSRSTFHFRQCIWGASAGALRLLLEKEGYSLVGVTPRLDLFWARNELLSAYNVPKFDSFVRLMRLGPLHHKQQTNLEFLEWLVDVRAIFNGQSIQDARKVAKADIMVNIKGKTRLPCFNSPLLLQAVAG
eukprot:CAMPEP_0183825880 /NCGR_PEP_ID=MMETSP0807_2-20130328/1387_1 /TAXON_ID=88271 /ORGANISM="Picocystis salinarum, Strain CCMP1897" /LENGTH=642 /DNA_ID=CAMNT_0026070939 /DNA_START=421 /DNA_END=2350 /DNA_ORIENTATION=-